VIQLHSDCLLFEMSGGQTIPCSAERVTFELIGEAARFLDQQLIHHAAAAVLHYFKVECQRTFVTVGEFSLALEKVLRELGIAVSSEPETAAEDLQADLRELAAQSGKGFELFFFARLREKFREMLEASPEQVRFHGLRGCVKQLAGAQRWTGRCEILSDQIVEYLRSCLMAEKSAADCALWVK
jgi:hypothetical protein